jgi:hypothetical protein
MCWIRCRGSPLGGHSFFRAIASREASGGLELCDLTALRFDREEDRYPENKRPRNRRLGAFDLSSSFQEKLTGGAWPNAIKNSQMSPSTDIRAAPR